MKHTFWLYSACLITLLLPSCANRNREGNPLETGPFDSAGNYREDWVADPSKWSRPGSKPAGGADELPLVADNDVPPPDSTPLAAVQEQPKPTVRAGSKRSQAQTAPKPVVSQAGTASRSAAQRTPATVKAKAKVKAKPKSRGYVVQKGDSLDRIARKTGSSVAALQKANGIKGTLIHPGKVLVVPAAKR